LYMCVLPFSVNKACYYILDFVSSGKFWNMLWVAMVFVLCLVWSLALLPHR